MTYVVIPTFNEKENIAALIQALLSGFTLAGVIVVDDGSPDGTGAIVQGIAAQNAKVHLIERKGKGGRGSACLAGFRKAMELGAEWVVEMDADFSHDPRELGRLLEVDPSVDMVIGSRYVSGSRIVGWSLQRRIFSRMANFYARRVLGIPIRDYTNGYRRYSRRAMAALDFDRIVAKGYIVLSEISYQLFCKGLSFAEVPITFVNRRRGNSNVNFREIGEAFSAVVKIKARYGKMAP